MAITQLHMRFLWGAFDLDVAEGQTPAYVGSTQYATLGPDATPDGGIGVRRATLVLDRSAASPADDDALMHFDFLNITAGAPDDTWITSDYTTLEGFLSTYFAAVAALIPAYVQFKRVLWHRIGPGVVPPNPAERILDFGSPASASGSQLLPPQCASSITFRTGVRRSWGRTYLPLGAVLATNGRLTNAQADTLATATDALHGSAAGADFHPVVVSNHLNSALGIETVEVDNVVDIIRRRRWKHTTYRKLIVA